MTNINQGFKLTNIVYFCHFELKHYISVTIRAIQLMKNNVIHQRDKTRNINSHF